MKSLDIEVLERIEGLIFIEELANFRESLQVLTDDLLEEGFEYKEIKAYFQLVLNEILGDQ